jgi:hypothetical protein
MLPDFPRLKTVLARQAGDFIEAYVQQDPLLSRIRRVPVFEGNELVVQYANGGEKTTGFERILHAFEVNKEELIDKGVIAYHEKLPEIAEEALRRRKELLFRRTGEACEEAGTAIDAQGRPFGPDLFLEMLERVEIDFDEDGQPRLPTVVVSPEMGAYIRSHMAKWEADEQFQARRAQIIEEKRNRWIDRESHRQLVD